MKTIKRIGLLMTSLLIVLLVVACNGDKNDLSGVAGSNVNDVYTSSLSVSYTNMRPMYNYYLFTVEYQQVTLYEDNTYVLSSFSTTHSAIVISEDDLGGYELEEGEEVEEFSGVKSNPRATTTMMYFGTYELDNGSLKLSQPFRIVSMIADSGGMGLSYVDTMSDWPEHMNLGAFYTQDPQSGEWATNVPVSDQNGVGYLKRRAFDATTVTVNETTKVMSSKVSLPNRNDEQAKNYGIDDLKEIENKPTSPSYAKIDRAYMGVIPKIDHEEIDANNYVITFKFQTLINFGDGNYELSENKLSIKNLKLALEGSDWEGDLYSISTTRYMGKYKSVVDEYDEDAYHITLEKPIRIVKTITKDASETTLRSAYLVDTNDWKESMNASLPSSENKTAEEFLKLNAFNELELFATHAPGNGFTPEEFVLD